MSTINTDSLSERVMEVESESLEFFRDRWLILNADAVGGDPCGGRVACGGDPCGGRVACGGDPKGGWLDNGQLGLEHLGALPAHDSSIDELLEARLQSL
jgi:hypothetical protein